MFWCFNVLVTKQTDIFLQVMNHSEDVNDAKDGKGAKSAREELATASAALAGGLQGRKHD